MLQKPIQPSASPTSRHFMQLLRAEWLAFWKTRGAIICLIIMALAVLGLGSLVASGDRVSCDSSDTTGEAACPTAVVGPNGTAVNDKSYLVHRSLTGDGSITVRLSSLTGIITYPPPNHNQITQGVTPWAKAGVIVRENTKQGSPYAAVVLTGSHGVRMQSNYAEDVASSPGGVSVQSPRWLRLTRSGEMLTGYESADGKQWTKIHTTRLAQLSNKVQIGFFVNSPCDLTSSKECRFTQATAVFDQVDLQGQTSSGSWSGNAIGGPGKSDWERRHNPAGFNQTGSTFTVSGSGDMSPVGLEAGGHKPIESTLRGTWIGSIAVIGMAIMVITSGGHRHLALLDRRTLAAKVAVVTAVPFITGLVSAAIGVMLGWQVLHATGSTVLPVTQLTGLRVIVGTALMLTLTAILALALALLFRRRVVAITVAIGGMVLPWILATSGALPADVSEWLLRLTPAAGFAIQQSIPAYPQVAGSYVPQMGYYPLAPGLGLAVLGGYTLLALGMAILRPKP